MRSPLALPELLDDVLQGLDDAVVVDLVHQFEEGAHHLLQHGLHHLGREGRGNPRMLAAAVLYGEEMC